MERLHRADFEVNLLWKEWLAHRDLNARNRLIDIYLPWVKKLARIYYSRYRSGLSELADFTQVGIEALIKSIERFDCNRGGFKPFAYKSIKGALIDCAALNISPGMPWNIDANDIIRSLDDGDGTEEGLLDYAIELVLGLSFPVLLHEHYTYISRPFVNPQTLCLAERTEVRLGNLVEKLEGHEKYVIEAHYRQNKTFSAIATELNLSQSRISQLHLAALKNLRRFY